MKITTGGICAAKGFSASGINCGIRKSGKFDLALIKSEVRATTAGTYTKNLVKGAPIIVSKKNLEDGYAQAIIVNSGNANTCNSNGIEIAEGMCSLVEKYTGIPASDVAIASTGLIGKKLSLTPIENGMDQLVNELGNNSKDAASAILTTDTVTKEIAYEFTIQNKVVKIGGIAKGSGMIHPNMATMLAFISTDANITPELLQKSLSYCVSDTFNMISVDGDTSTNDTVFVMANGMAENPIINEENDDYKLFTEALLETCKQLAKSIARDGEGATKLIECNVSGAPNLDDAKLIAKAIICSPLVKTAMYGSDANWGRILCATGYAEADIDVDEVNVSFESDKGSILVCENGSGVDFSEEKAKEILLEAEIKINVSVGKGNYSTTAYGCDLSYEYVRINGDYRS